jgi:hypothetical protein
MRRRLVLAVGPGRVLATWIYASAGMSSTLGIPHHLPLNHVS